MNAAVEMVGHLLVPQVRPANEQKWAQVKRMAEVVQEVTGEMVELAYMDQGCAGEELAEAAAAHGITLEVVKRPNVKGGSVLPSCREIVERTFVWRRACGASLKASSACRTRPGGTILAPSPVSCSRASSPCSWVQVHNRL